MENQRLKPCPFCGGRPFLEKSMRCFINGKTDKAALVRCLDCGARASRVRLSDYGKSSHSKEAEEEAANMWNNRIAPQN